MNRLLVDLRRYVLLFVYNMFEYQEEISHILRLWVCSYGSIEFIGLWCDSVDTAR